MTISLSDNTPRVSYSVAEGVTQTSFTVNFEFFDDADLNFYVDGTLKTLTTHYTVTGGDGSTGTITTTAGNSVTGITGGSTVVITRSIALERTTDFPSSGAFEVSKLNTELDRFTAIAAEISDDNDRSIHLADDDSTVSMELPSKADRVGKVLGFNATTGAAEAGPTIADVSSLSAITADISTLADIEDGTDATDAIQTVAGISSNVTTVAGISANVTTVAGISSDVTAVVADQADIGTVATNIASVNTVATNIADVITVANDLNEAVSEVVTVADDLNEAVSEIDTVAGSISNVDTVGTNISNVNTVAGISANVTTVAGVSANVTTVAGISSNVTTVAGISSDVTAVAGDATDIGTVATNISNVNTVGGISGNVTTVAGISANVTTVAGISSDVSTVAGDSTAINAVANDATDIGLVAGSIANVNNVGGSIANVNTVASNLASVNNFAEVYRIESSAPTTSLDLGDLYFDTTSDTLKVYGSSGWQNAGSSVNGTSQRYHYDITGTPTSVTGTDANGNTLAYDAGYVDVYVNGVRMSQADVTVTSGDTVTFASALSDGDEVDIVGYGTFSVASLNADNLDSGTIPDARFPATLPAIDGSNLTGITSVGGATGVSFDDNVKAQFGAGTDLSIFHDGTHSYITESNATGDLRIRATNLVFQATDETSLAEFNDGGAVNLRYSGNLKLQTKTDGVDIIGELQSDSLDVDGNADISNTLTMSGGNINLIDSDGSNGSIYFGANNDLRIRHNGSASYIDQQGTGSLYIRNTTDNLDIILQSDNGSGGLATYIKADGSSGETQLYHYGSEKLNTTSSGVTVTGTVTATSFSGDGSSLTGSGIAKAWVNFNGKSTLSVRNSYNVTSVTDLGTGNYRPNLTNAFGNDQYIVTCSGSQDDGSIGAADGIQPYDLNSGSVEIATFGAVPSTRSDLSYVLVMCHGD